MKKAREKWFIKGRMEKKEQEQHHKRKQAHKIIRNKEKTYTKNVSESIAEDQKHNNTGKMYQRVNQFKKGYQHTFSIIRNKKGELAMNTREKTEIWKEYFDKFLNTEEPRELHISKKLKLRLNNTIIDKPLIYASETRMLTTRDGEKFNIFERKVYRRILGQYMAMKNKIEAEELETNLMSLVMFIILNICSTCFEH